MCNTCQSDTRKIWGPSQHRPKLNDIDIGNYIALQQCPECGTLWMDSPYEPYSSFSYRVLWPHSPAEWRTIHDIDDGLILHQWLKQQIKALWQSLPEAEIEAVAFHRKRSSGYYNPIDMPEEKNPDLKRIIENIKR